MKRIWRGVWFKYRPGLDRLRYWVKLFGVRFGFRCWLKESAMRSASPIEDFIF